MIVPARLRLIALAIGVASTLCSTIAVACDKFAAAVMTAEPPCITDTAQAGSAPSWIFRRSTYSHDPYTGARVAQYMRTPPVEPLDDPRLVTSRYRRSRTNLRGTQGSNDTYYEVQAWGNGRGGIDAEWERFHDAWKESYLSGGFYNQGPGSAPWGWSGGHPGGWFGPGFGVGGPGFGVPGGGFPGHGGPGFGLPAQGGWNHEHHGNQHHRFDRSDRHDD
jgi:hypothetical protein